MAVTELSVLSTEFVHVSVTATIAGAGVTTSETPQLALLAHNGSPEEDDWLDAEWAGPTARILVGPTGGALTLDPGTCHVWLRFTAGAETPVYRAGYLRAY